MQKGVLDIYYYNNPKGWTAISLDEGETIILHDGRKIPLNDIWEESADDLEDDLSTKQKEKLLDFRARPPMTEIEQMAWDLRKRRLEEARFYAKPAQPPVHIPDSLKVVTSEMDGEGGEFD